MSTSFERARQLLDLFETGKIPRLAEHEVNPGLDKASRENYLYFTLPCCINFQRNSPAMWQSALATYLDPETNYLFFPELVTEVPIEKVRTDLGKHRLALQPNKHTQIWLLISTTLHKHFQSDPRAVLQEANYDAGELVQLLQVTRRTDFPYLSGPKLSNYWPFILSQYTDLKLSNVGHLSIIPDTHVIQASIHLGLIPEGATALQAEAAWKDLLHGTDIHPVTMHPVLWNWSRNKFQPAV